MCFAPRSGTAAHQLRCSGVGHDFVAGREVVAGGEYGKRSEGQVPADADGSRAVLGSLSALVYIWRHILAMSTGIAKHLDGTDVRQPDGPEWILNFGTVAGPFVIGLGDACCL